MGLSRLTHPYRVELDLGSNEAMPDMTVREGRNDAPAIPSSDDLEGTRLKVCGLTEQLEVDALAAHSVDFAGLWYGVPGGPADLELGRWVELATATAGEGIEPVLVTFSKDAEFLTGALRAAPVKWVQLHGYQTPGLVRALKREVPDVRVLKVLHVRGQDCVEAPLIGSYEKAGVDVFLFDAVAADGKVGSTGETLDVDFVLTVAEKLSRPFLIAGGISPDNRERHEALIAHPLYLGVDVDTNARDADGRIAADNVGAISATWKGRR
jgi:phosphoribosylanthranilate isomerase